MKKEIKLFEKTLKMELKLYIHSWWIWGMLFILCLYLSSGYYAFFMRENDYGQLLQSSAFIVMGSILMGLFAGISFSQREKKVAFEEVIETYPSRIYLILGKLCAWFIISFLFAIISSLFIIIAYLSVGSQLKFFWKDTVAYIMLYWGLSFLSAGLIGYSLDKFVHSAWKYVIAVIVWQITSPYNTYLPKKIAFLFNQGQEVPNGSYDPFIGLNIDIGIVFRHLFFLLVAVAFVLLAIYVHYRFQKRYKIRLFTSIIIIILLGATIIPFANHKTVWDWDSVDNASIESLNFYSNYIRNESTGNEISSDFKVEAYEINLKHHNESISYKAKIDISITNKKLHKLHFSLYHGLKVIEVSSGSENLEWEQKGDNLAVNWNQKKYKGTIDVKVSGNTGYKNLITKRSFFLSSTFAWYPVPATLTLADKTPLWYVQYRNASSLYPIKFNVKIDSDKKIYSNLIKVGDNHFEGEEYGVTLVYGRLLKNQMDNITIIAPPDMAEDANVVYHMIQDASKKINKNIQVNKKINPQYIFVVPIYDYLSLDAFPMEYAQNQLFISAHDLKVLNKNHFVREDFVLPVFYWFNQYRQVNNRVPIVLTCLYNKLFGKQWTYTFENLLERSKHYKPITPSDNKLLEIAKVIIDLYEQGYENELKIQLITFFELADKDQLNLDTIERHINMIKIK